MELIQDREDPPVGTKDESRIEWNMYGPKATELFVEVFDDTFADDRDIESACFILYKDQVAELISWLQDACQAME